MGTKKYTMEEFKEMYEKAQREVIEELDNQMKEAMVENGKEENPMFVVGFTMQNVLTTAKVYSKLLKEEN